MEPGEILEIRTDGEDEPIRLIGIPASEFKWCLVQIRDGAGRQWTIPGYLHNGKKVLEEIQGIDGSNLILSFKIIEEEPLAATGPSPEN